MQFPVRELVLLQASDSPALVEFVVRAWGRVLLLARSFLAPVEADERGWGAALQLVLVSSTWAEFVAWAF